MATVNGQSVATDTITVIVIANGAGFNLLSGPVSNGDGTATIKIACESGPLTSPLRIGKNGTTYGILLVPPTAVNASKLRIQTASGTKALQKLP